MKKISKLIPGNYEQPLRGYIGRSVKDTLEEVDYVPESHLRIWYNCQPEGYSMHHHGAMEVILCMENQYTIIANGKTYLLNVGDILLIPPHMLHEIQCDSDGVRFIFLINIEILASLQDYKTIEPLFMEAYLCNAALQPEIYQSVYACFMQMIDIYFSNSIFWETSIYALLFETFEMIGRNHFQQNSDAETGNSLEKQRDHYEKFAALLNYIDSNYTEDLTLEQAAAYVGFSKYHFSRLFKEHANSTFYDYLCHKRVQVAQSLLSTGLPITDIAFQTGFNNLTTFCRCFKKCTNCSPSEYRNKFRQEQVR